MEKINQEQELLLEKIEEPNKEIKIKQYLKGKLIGVGGFAKCYEGINLDNNCKIAIKVINKITLSKNRAKQKLLSEIKIHKMLNHPYIVRFLTVFEDLQRVYIIVELCQNKALSDFVRRRKRLSTLQVKRFMIQLIQALEYMHSMKVIHRDIKMANIFLDKEMNIKVGDFGLSAKIQYAEQKKRTMCGTPNYIAPQIILGETGHSYQVDLWSAGVICYAMFYGRPPFETSDIKKTYEKIKNCQFQFHQAEGLIPQFKDFIKRTLVYDPKKRMNLKQMLQHPFLNSGMPKLTYNMLTMTPIHDTNSQIMKTIFTQSNVFDIKEKQSTQSTMKQETVTTQEPVNSTKKDEDSPHEWNYISVLNYVDYSTKYGLGYKLSDNNYGVYFNDSSLMSYNVKQTVLTYIQNPAVEEDNLKVVKYNISEITNDHQMNKKYLLLKRFKFYLDDQAKNKSQSRDFSKDNKLIYVKQWLKTKHAIMFRLNNKIFQVDFFDDSRITLNTDSKYVLVKNKKGISKIMTLPDARSQKDTQISRRIKYIKDILNSLKQK